MVRRWEKDKPFLPGKPRPRVRNIGDGMSEGGRARVGVEKRAVWQCGRSGDASLGKDKSFPLGKPEPRFGVAALRGT